MEDNDVCCSGKYGCAPVQDAFWVITDKDGVPLNKQDEDQLIRDMILYSQTYIEECDLPCLGSSDMCDMDPLGWLE